MAVIRVNKTKDYTVMSNIHFKEKEMSLKAKGLLSLMLSLPDDWDYSISGLVAICVEKESAINATLNELKKFGYLKVDKLMPNQTKSGRIEYVYNIFENPKQDLEKQNTEKQDLENQGVEKQGVENQGQLNTNKSITKKQNTNKLNTDIYNIFDHWNSKNIIVHKALTDTMSKQITKAIKEYGVESVKEYIDRYSQVYQDKDYYFDTKWTLSEFLKQSNAIGTFSDEGSKWLNYLSFSNSKKIIRCEDGITITSGEEKSSWAEEMEAFNEKILEVLKDK